MKTIEINVNASIEFNDWKMLWQTLNAYLGLGQTIEMTTYEEVVEEDLDVNVTMKRMIVEVGDDSKAQLNAVNALLDVFYIDATIKSVDMLVNE